MIWLLAIILVLLVGFLVYFFMAGPKLPPDTDDIIDDVMKHKLTELVTGKTGFAVSDGLKIWYESIMPEGKPKGAVLLIMGDGGNALDWPPKFVQTLNRAGYQVIRYDQRSTGLSDQVANWSRKHPYTLADMAGDAVAVLDALKIRKAHLIGLSMGGMIAQEVAIAHPNRVSSLTLLSTSGFIGDPDVPSLSSSYLLGSLVKSLPLFRYRLLGGDKNLIKERIAKMVAHGYKDLDIQEIAETILYDLRNEGA